MKNNKKECLTIISGNTGSGKITILNNEEIILVKDTIIPIIFEKPIEYEYDKLI
jgi:Tfp pilus assembly pilus retraction ATPase PilT